MLYWNSEIQYKKEHLNSAAAAVIIATATAVAISVVSFDFQYKIAFDKVKFDHTKERHLLLICAHFGVRMYSCAG